MPARPQPPGGNLVVVAPVRGPVDGISGKHRWPWMRKLGFRYLPVRVRVVFNLVPFSVQGLAAQ